MAKAGDPVSTELFYNLESYIRWKGKEDSARYSGKSMLRTLARITVEVYRYMWILVLELWAVTEEKIQFSHDRDYKHDLIQEFAIYQGLKDLYLDKISRIEKKVEMRRQVGELEEDLAKISQKPEVMSKMKSKILGEPAPPKEDTKE